MGPRDVAFDIKVRRECLAQCFSFTLLSHAALTPLLPQFCGICHSDLHQARSEWGPTNYPCVPGHELVGVVTSVGAEVTRFSEGDRVGVGCLVNSCRSCKQCVKGGENYCAKQVRGAQECADSLGSDTLLGSQVFSYNSKLDDGRLTFGGYSSRMVCNEEFVLRMPSNLPLDAAAPLLCAGITVYSPMKLHGLDKPGIKLGVLGLGGLGHCAVKFGVAFGCEVTTISTSAGKEAEAKAMGATHFLLSSDKAAMAAAIGSLDGIVDTVSANHDIGAYLNLLDVHGKLVLVGVPPEPFTLGAFSFIGGGKTVVGSLIGGLPQTQEMLDFCGEKGITCDIEKIPVDYVNEAFSRMLKSDVHYRFVIDMATLKA